MIDQNKLRSSAFRVISIGVVAENKALDTDIVSILPLEILQSMGGELGSTPSEESATGISGNGDAYDVNVKVGTTIKADWMGETNRITSPDVRRGEQVLLWQSGDSDDYYWSAMGRDDNLRRLETVQYRYSGSPDIVNAPITEDNSYYVEVSTHKKLITVSTSKRNSEVVRYRVQIDPGNGTFTVTDDLGNHIQLDSVGANIRLHNSMDTTVELNKKDIFLKAPNNIDVTCENMLIEASKDMTINVGGDYTITADKHTTEAGTIGFKANAFTMEGGSGGGVTLQSDTGIQILSQDKAVIRSPTGVRIEGADRTEEW